MKAIKVFGATFLASLFLITSTAHCQRVLQGGEPFVGGQATATYKASVIERPLADTHPSIMYDPDDPARPYKMWWLCGFELSKTKFDDVPNTSNKLHTTDRICMAWTTDLQMSWQAPFLSPERFEVLKGASATGSTTNNMGDDILLGSPSVIKVDCGETSCPGGITQGKLYVMFYEGYGNWMSRINRFWNSALADTYITGDFPPPSLTDLRAGDQWESFRSLGYAPQFLKRGTKPVYSCQVTYYPGQPQQKVNRFLQVDTPCLEGSYNGFNWEGLHKNWSYGEFKSIPVFWTYIGNEGRPDRRKLYRCWDGVLLNTFATLESTCDGVPGAILDGDLGWVSVGFTDTAGTAPASDMVGANQNRIHMAYSSDGVNWTRFNGGSIDGNRAVILPQDQTPMRKYPCPDQDNPWSFHDTYGAGYPMALLRDNNVEVWFYDDTSASTTDDSVCERRAVGRYRVVIPLADLFNVTKWREVTALNKRWVVSDFDLYDVKWSPEARRYFGVSIVNNGVNKHVNEMPNPDYRQAPKLVWSGIDPAAMGNSAPLMLRTDPFRFNNDCPAPGSQEVSLCPPTNTNNTSLGRLGFAGGIMGDEYGHVLFLGDEPQFHVFYAASPTESMDDPHSWELDHLHIFGTLAPAP